VIGVLLRLQVIAWQVPTPMILVTGGCMLVAAGIVTAVWLGRRKAPVWLLVAGSVMAIQLTAVGSLQVYNHLYNSHSRNFAHGFSTNLPAGVTVYEIIPGHDLYPSECYYLNRRVVRLNNIADLPVRAKNVYVLGRHRMPVSPFYEWHELSDITEYKKMKLRLWEGVRR
jgi:hypothetical protein